MRKIAEYIAHNISGAGEYCTAMVSMELPDLTEPPAPADADDIVAMRWWDTAYKRWECRMEEHRQLTTQIFPISWTM